MALDMEALRNILNNKPKGGGGGGYNKEDFYDPPKQGEFKIRFLPPVHGGVPGKLVYKHWQMPGERKMLTCLKTYNMECSVCKTLSEYAGRAHTEDYDSKPSFHENVLVLSDPGISPSLPKIISLGDFNFYWLIEQCMDPDIGDITNEETGRPVKFKRAVKNKAWERILLPGSPIAPTKELRDQILNARHDMNKIWRDPDDNYFKMLNDACVGVREMLDNQIMTARAQGPAASGSVPKTYSEPVVDKPPPVSYPSTAQQAPQQTQPPATQPTPTTPPPATTQAAKGGKPVGSPDCFGDLKTYYAGFGSYDKVPPRNTQSDDQKAQILKCTNCPHDYECGKGA